MVVRNTITTNETGSNFFNKSGRGVLGYPTYGPGGALVDAAPDSQFVSYAWNAGGQEEGLNTYGALTFLGAEWGRPHGWDALFPSISSGRVPGARLPVAAHNPRWWKFAGASELLERPQDDLERYRRMAEPVTLDSIVQGAPLGERLANDGLTAEGNWIGLYSVGPFPRVAPGASVTVTWAFVAALKPESFQGLAARPLDTEESRTLLRNNVFWAQRTYAGEDLNYNGELDAGEDLNGNGQLDRYLIPEPPRSPRLHVEVEPGRAILYWNEAAEASVDPITGRTDFEGYRIYRSDPGDDLDGNLFGEADLVAQFDSEGNSVGFNTGLGPVRLNEPVSFPGDSTVYTYRYEAEGLLSGWQYAFAVTAFDTGDAVAGLAPFESSTTANAVRVFPGTAAASGDARPGAGSLSQPVSRAGSLGWHGEHAAQALLR